MIHNGFGSPELLSLNSNDINWDAPAIPRCTRCEDVLHCSAPGSGSYASTSEQFAALLGPLEERTPRLRCVVLFDEPRDARRPARFSVVAPQSNPASIPDGMHRYFFLSRTAWHAQALHQVTGSDAPEWPGSTSRAHFLATYLRYRPSRWSYDAFLAYVFFLLRPEFGYVTNVAKCHFGADYNRSQMQSVCARHILGRELALIRPNLVISMSRGAEHERQLRARTGYEGEMVVLRWQHTAARGGPGRKLARMLETIEDQARALSRLGLDAERLVREIRADAELSIGVS